ncbi:ATP-binding cassette domain-containing protein [Candidatus Bathyarchaeota archaeon]|nr:ATP-binding cassette domain-containing protein [Candidatus Bathyarchaeota archaeon]
MESLNQGRPIIALEDVSLQREGVRILDRINWWVFPAEHWAIIGENGAGKTRLLEIVATYLWPSRGRVEVLGKEFGKVELHQLRQKISWISSALEQELPQRQPVLEVVLSGYFSTLRLFVRPQRETVERALTLLRLAGLQHRARQIFATLSTGEKRQILIARAMMKQPKILILDEVCAGLDPVARRGYLNSVRRLIRKESSINVLFATHHLEEIFPEVTHVLGLKRGQILFSGRKEDQLTQKNIRALFDGGVRLRISNGTYYLEVC